ncbi:MAG TPA: hypothetical protein VMJ10_30010 [Kofleriaceae bacterium]|nr:hypothetical protein [Kofleriaceae bacterium]
MEQAIIEVVAGYSPFAYLYALVKATIAIDGAVVRRGWGTHAIPVAPGRHVVEVSYPWLPFARRAGRNEVSVEVAAGETVRVHYTARLVRYIPGKMRVEDRIPSARVVD